jgi:hypothetical protein
VFVGEGRKIGLLRHQVKVYRRSLQVVSKQSLKDPCGQLLGLRQLGLQLLSEGNSR